MHESAHIIDICSPVDQPPGLVDVALDLYECLSKLLAEAMTLKQYYNRE
jgi:hypothetical protein